MSKRVRSGKSSNETVREYTLEVKKRALDEQSDFFAVVMVAKKPKLKHNGIIRVDNPFYCVMAEIIASNLPVPTSLYNPVFKMKRENLLEPFNPKLQTFVGIVSAEEFFTLADFTNNFNFDVDDKGIPEPKEYYSASIFTQVFDTQEAADYFIDQLLDDMRKFLNELANFVKEERVWGILDWEGKWLCGTTKAWVDHEKQFVQPFVSSFMERLGGIKPLVDEDGKEIKGV